MIIARAALLMGLAAPLAGFDPAPAAAQSSFSPPQGCSGTLTVQSRSCLVTHVWTCEGEEPGMQWVALFDLDGLARVRQIDEEFQWLTTYSTNPQRVQTMEVPAADPESLTVLFAEGYDTYDFTIHSDGGYLSERIIGYDRLTGESVTIDGEPLLRTEFAYEVQGLDGTVFYALAGNQYVSETHRLFFFGTEWEVGNPDQVFDASPVEFIYPGEPGFFASSPRYDCGATLSSYQVPS